MINADMLDEKIALLQQQKEQHFGAYQQAIGAIAICQHLKETLAGKDHLTTDQLGEALGGTVEAIEPIE